MRNQCVHIKQNKVRGQIRLQTYERSPIGELHKSKSHLTFNFNERIIYETK
ncbi:unnamed protein product [marine sediment metagenome]|uniref:Uncharacterized protein n=1 Tax=marine sediment metagenome TaxID=412755 RepID=X1RCU9_9ZZZZ